MCQKGEAKACQKNRGHADKMTECESQATVADKDA